MFKKANALQYKYNRSTKSKKRNKKKDKKKAKICIFM